MAEISLKNRTQKANSIKDKITTQSYIKTSHSCPSRTTLKEQKGKLQNGRQSLQLREQRASKQKYIELLQINNKKTYNPIEK